MKIFSLAAAAAAASQKRIELKNSLDIDLTFYNAKNIV
jgi:hypothetical protein